MNAPVLIRVGQRLISGIDDRAVLLHPLKEIVHNIVSALRDLKREESLLSVPMARASRHKESIHLNPAALRTSCADTPGSGKDLPGNEEGHKGSEAAPGKGKAPRDEIVLVRPKGRVGLMIHIVLDERHLFTQPVWIGAIYQFGIAGA